LPAILTSIREAKAADGCGPGFHSTPGGACVVDGWVPAQPFGTERDEFAPPHAP